MISIRRIYWQKYSVLFFGLTVYYIDINKNFHTVSAKIRPTGVQFLFRHCIFYVDFASQQGLSFMSLSLQSLQYLQLN